MTAGLKQEATFTKGRILSKMLAFIIPLIFTNILQTLYNMADMMIVGLSGEGNSVGAIGVTATYNALVLNLIIGASTGVNVLIAQRIGAKDDNGVRKTLHTSFLLMIIFGVFVGVIGMAFARIVLSLMGTSGNLLDLAVTYSCWYFAGTPFIALTNCAISVFRAKGDSKIPLIIMSICGLINVLLNLFFVIALNMDVDGVALATTVSNAISAVWLFLLLAKDKGVCKFSFKALSLDGKTALSVVKIGVPMALQGMAMALSHMINQTTIIQVDNAVTPIGSEYQPVIKGNSVESNIEGVSSSAVNAVQQGAVVFAGQNYGAKDFSRLNRIMLCSYFIAFLITTIFVGATVILKDYLCLLYDVDPNATDTLGKITYQTYLIKIKYILYPFCFSAFMNVGTGILCGMGKTTLSAGLSLTANCFLRVLWVFTIFRAFPTLDNAYLCYPLTWILCAVIVTIINMVIIVRGKKLLNKVKN